MTQPMTEQEATLRHSTAHVLAQAVLSLWPDAHYAGGPPIENPPGFYYDFDIGRPFTPEDLEKLEIRMAEIIAADQPFERDEVSLQEAKEIFKDQPYKLQWIEGIGEDAAEQGVEGNRVSIYRNGDAFVDLCRGPHVQSTGQIKAFKLLRTGGAYWLGNEKNPMLQRIYGTAWATKQELDAFLELQEEMLRRDHRRIGVDQDLFSFPPEVGGGLPVFHPKGGLVRKLMEDYSRAEHEAAGYEFVWTPHIARSGLFQTSGHLDWYGENMYPPMEMEGATYYPKPMNCPMHSLIYRSRTRSYRELPLRLFEFGTVYRFERSGVLHGLTRVRGITQDDAHIFCTRDQLAPELASLLAFVLKLLRTFGLTEFKAELATRPEKFIGDPDDWDEATEALRAALVDAGIPFTVGEGEGAFYAPKIDIHVNDAIGRPWQMSTLQVDFNLPDRFDLEYVGEDGARHRPFMIHRALFGSVERFFGILVEHYLGAFPTWLAPVQVLIIPVKDPVVGYAESVADSLRAAGVRVDIDRSSESLGKKVRNAQMAKAPYMVVVGDKEAAAQNLSVRPRGGDERRGVPLDGFVRDVCAEIAQRGSPESSRS